MWGCKMCVTIHSVNLLPIFTTSNDHSLGTDWQSNRGLYAAISADQAANLAPPGISISISHFQLSKEEKQPKGRKLVGFPLSEKDREKNLPKRLVFNHTFPKLGYQA